MRSEQKGNVKNSVGRVALAALAIIAQVVWLVYLIVKLNKYSTVISLCSSLIALLLVLKIYSKRTNSAFKTLWIILILVFPVVGISFYFLFGNKHATAYIRRKFSALHCALFSGLCDDGGVLEELSRRDYYTANQFRYLSDRESFPVYNGTAVRFFSQAADGFEAQLCDIARAKEYIFMEYHAVEDMESFSRLFELLAQKAADGVEVRLLYDDVGSIGFVNFGFVKKMRQSGISCKVFNPVLPVLQIFMNNRDHRKITVIDGKVAFTGGYNLADEYFNITHPYGRWKDTGLRLEGNAVDSLLAMFLEMWNCTEKHVEHFKKYFRSHTCHVQDGFVQPYADSPLDNSCVGENVYLNLIKSAAHYIYITTPYLIISDEMNRELTLAAQRGVDVRIITPGIPDKKLIYRVTRSYYPALAGAGVRIFEYTPGFMHAKQMLTDGKTAAVGTINLDYRSLYHHFENGVLMHGCQAVNDILRDFEDTFAQCREVTEKYSQDRFAVTRGIDCILRLAAPLL